LWRRHDEMRIGELDRAGRGLEVQGGERERQAEASRRQLVHGVGQDVEFVELAVSERLEKRLIGRQRGPVLRKERLDVGDGRGAVHQDRSVARGGYGVSISWPTRRLSSCLATPRSGA